MDISLKFKITLRNEAGEYEETEQEITVPGSTEMNAPPFEQQQVFVMQKMFSQYAQVGVLRQVEPRKFLLCCPSQIAFVECELPSILVANPSDVPRPKVTLD